MDVRLQPYSETQNSDGPSPGEIPAHWEACRLKYAAAVNPMRRARLIGDVVIGKLDVRAAAGLPDEPEEPDERDDQVVASGAEDEEVAGEAPDDADLVA
jgi:hypothetical protein